ncbi:MAG: SUMF1/EgtB/PvdO family nonheme iron enzyme, partial [Kiritimatiellae bacterium]|nr:SUMF1/EgtB/PvdO family nonheme iron enzyme [Kiritimatiellia bacterium]
AFGEDFTIVTTNGGYYSVTVPEGWSGTATPDAARGTFAPAARMYEVVQSDQSNQNYGIADIHYEVIFDLGERGIRTGGGELQQMVMSGTGATAPSVQVDEGWLFAGWDVEFDEIYEDLRVHAYYSFDDMVLIPGGTYWCGDAFSEGNTNELPRHEVTLDSFYMQRQHVTLTQWVAVVNWSIEHGYDLSEKPAVSENHPVRTIRWYDGVKWCNARSEMEGLPPVYYTDETQSTVYRTGYVNVVNAWVRWEADGYRLPTEAEWEYAARGGLEGQRFPWGNTISLALANFSNKGGESYATGATGDSSGPTIAGSYASNGYGLYDMAGNMLDWCWDLHGPYDATPKINPRGPSTTLQMTNRVLRGGSYGSYAAACRVAWRNNDALNLPYQIYSGIGLRVARGMARTIISGQVTNAITGEGISGVLLTSDDGEHSVTTGEDGAYSLNVEEPGWTGRVDPVHPFGAGVGAFTPAYRNYEAVEEDVPDQDYGWLPPDPEVDAVSPAWGSLAGGEEIEIHGRYFSNPGVFFGEVPAASVTMVNHELLRVTVPEAQAGGGMDVWVINDDGTEVTVPNGYEYRPVISGRVTRALTDIGIEGVRILVEGQEEEIWTDENGAYSVTVSAPWSGHVMAYEEGGRTFDPAELYYEDIGEDVLDADFTWTPSSVTVRGRVYNAGNQEGLVGVTVTFSPGGTTVTTSGGHFEKTLDYGWTGSFAPQMAEGQFTPAVRMLSQLALDTDSEDFSWGPTPTPGTKYVSLTGNNTFPYMSYETAAHEIQAAVNACEPGDEVVVLDGTYHLTAGGVLVSQPVTIRSLSGPEWTTVRRSSGRGGIFYLLASNAVLDGFTITGGSLSNSLPYGAKAAGVTATDGAEVRNCIIISNRADRISGAGGLSLDNGARAFNCLVVGNELIGGTGGGGVRIDRNSRLVNCTVYGNRGQSVQEWESYTEMVTEYYMAWECWDWRKSPYTGWYCFGGRWHLVQKTRSVPVTLERLVWVSRPGAGGVYQSTNGAVHVENSIVWGNSYGYSGSGSVSP